MKRRTLLTKGILIAGLLFGSTLGPTCFAQSQATTSATQTPAPMKLVVTLNDAAAKSMGKDDVTIRNFAKSIVELSGENAVVGKILNHKYIEIRWPAGKGTQQALSNVAARFRINQSVYSVDQPLPLSPHGSTAVQPTSYNDPAWVSQYDIYTGTSQRPVANQTVGHYNSGVADVIYNFGAMSSGIVVGVIDTGYFDHPDFSGKILNQLNYLETTSSGAPSTDAHAPDNSCNPLVHGAGTMGMIISTQNNSAGLSGIAPLAKADVSRVLDDCNGDTLIIAQAITDMANATTNKPQVINLSVGVAFDSTTNSYPACQPYVQDAINTAVQNGILVVASAGNDGVNQLSSPANCQNVISVGALDTLGQYTTYSNTSPALTIATVGGGSSSSSNSDLYMPVQVSRTADYLLGSGTSFSAPVVSGLLAYAKLANPGLTPVQAAQLLGV